MFLHEYLEDVYTAWMFQASVIRVSGPMLNTVQKSIHLMDYQNFRVPGTPLWYFLCSICWNLALVRYGKLESGSPWEVQQFLWIIYKISGQRNVALDLLRSMEMSGSLALPLTGHRKWRKACINICKHILKSSNCVLLRVLTNNNNYTFCYYSSKKLLHESTWCHLLLAPSRCDGHNLY